MKKRTFVAILASLIAGVAVICASLWASPARSGRGPRLRPSRQLADAYLETLCRLPADSETIRWDGRPFEQASLVGTLAATDEAQRVRQVREIYRELLRRDAAPADCERVREWVTESRDLDAVRRELARTPEARRVAQVRRVFIDVLGRDPQGWDDASLRRWVDSPYAVAEVRSRLAAARPLVGVHYFAWYRPQAGGGWGNDLTAVAPDSPKPAAGWYDSSDTDLMAAQIREIEDAGFDFVIVHVIAASPRTWSNARTFFDRLSGHRLSAAVLLDGLYADDAATKGRWVQQVQTQFTGDSHYLRLHGEPLVMLYSALLDFDAPGIALRNVYWTDRYDPGGNTFNPNRRLEPRDWAFWAPTPQPLVNGVVPVIPGYTDAALGRARTMVHERDGGRMYREQWQRALALRPELVVVYSWNEYFERTGIEPTDAWGNQYVRMTSCFIAHAHRGTAGPCE